MNGKKGISLEFTAALIFAVLLFTVAGVAFARMLSGADSTAYNSYEDVVKNVVSISGKESGAQDSQIVTLYKDGALIGFNEEPYLLVKEFAYSSARWRLFEKPDDCGDAKSCICACSKLEEIKATTKLTGIELKYSDVRCARDEKSKVDCTPGSAMFAPAFKDCTEAVKDNCVVLTSNGGFLLFPGWYNPSRPRQRGITLENYRGLVGVCSGIPCMTADEKKTVDVGIFVRRAAYACLAGESCTLKDEIARVIAPTDRAGWKLRLQKKTVDAPEKLSSVRFSLENDKFEEVSYLIENPGGLKGPFVEDGSSGSLYGTTPFPFDMMNSTPWRDLKVYVVMADPVTGSPQWDTKKENFDLEFEQSQDTVKVTDKSGILGWVAGKSYVLVDVVNALDVPLDHPPYPLVFVVKE